jgi:hypothetical protein
VDAAADSGGSSIALHGDVLVVGVSHGQPRAGEPTGHSTAYDARGGAVLWRLDGWVPGHAPGGRLLVARETPASDDLSGWSYEFEAIEPRSRVPAWSIRLPAGTARSVAFDWLQLSGDGPARMVEWGDDGRLRSYDLATGAVVAERQLTDWPAETQVEVAGDTVLVSAPDGFLADLRAYGVDDLALRWEARVRSDFPIGCGPWICLPTDAGVRAVDPVTGVRAWERRGLQGGFPAGPPWPPGTLAASRMDGTGTELLDAATGRAVADLDVWSTVGGGDGPPFLVRSPHFAPGHQGSWLASFRPDVGKVEIVSALPDVTFCTTSGHYLACRTGQQVRVWRIHG